MAISFVTTVSQAARHKGHFGSNTSTAPGSMDAAARAGHVVAMANVALEPSTIDTRDFYPRNVHIHGFQITDLMEHGWDPRPDLSTAAEAWLMAGGSHHSVFTQALRLDALRDLAGIAGVELVVIDDDTTIPRFADELPPAVNPARQPTWGQDSFEFFPNFTLLFWAPGWYLTYHYWPTGVDTHIFEADLYFVPPTSLRQRLSRHWI